MSLFPTPFKWIEIPPSRDPWKDRSRSTGCALPGSDQQGRCGKPMETKGPTRGPTSNDLEPSVRVDERELPSMFWAVSCCKDVIRCYKAYLRMRDSW
jgi:hypothetical protein